ncbi:hypothetical protein NPS70_16460 [Streptomyces sp. C10-9-1]|uniref:hypothetical protein n=1 Tax=Streptomyces sp. C10-9-1 TaxID=1859285 RepID=UPI002113126D|nr:hypothetical protein [Streptomyces sp. C10-9-1]MCQ6554779.1 hypothetical protein [Streptomyces sp. C10-9-1]
MSKYGEGVEEPYAFSGRVKFNVSDYDAVVHADIAPDEARLLALRLIKMADEAEGQDW